ncbi:MAG: NACHT domain-containing protein [Chloroflexi bacterium]|nr:MAG: NACHT domain-containing protein [Chloroflexota bacterium]
MFNLDLWKQQTAEKLAGLSAWLKERRDRDLPYLTYGALCAFTLTPVVEALARGELLPVMVTLGSVAGGVGGNLIAEQVQRWKERAGRDEIAAWVAETAPDNPDLRAALDTILQTVEAIPQAQARLDEAGRAWFTETLRRELKALGSELTVTAAGDRAVAIGGDVLDSPIVTGDVGGDVVMPGGTKVIHPDPAAAARTHLRQTYLERFAHRCNALPLAALGADREAEEALTLDAVYVALDTKTRIPLTGEEKKSRRYRGDDRPLSALEAARQETRLALLGDPGSGKTTFVRQLAGRLARACLNPEEPLPGWDAPLFPLLTTLRRLAPALDDRTLTGLSAEEQTRQLVEAVCARWQADLADLRVEVTPAELERLLAGERLLVIFDGLDEVPDALRPWVNRAVQAVLHTYPNIERVIVTCRVRSYSGGAELSGFARHELAPFDKDKIRQFVAAWYGAQADRLGQSEAERRANDLRRAVLDRDLFPLARNPMLLTTMAIIHQQDARLPRERVKLYRRAVEILLQKWQKQKGLEVSEKLAEALSDEMKMRAILQLLAYRLHEQQARGGGDELPRKEIVAWLEGPAYLGDLALAGEFLEYVDRRAGLLVGRGGVAGEKPRVYDFPVVTLLGIDNV